MIEKKDIERLFQERFKDFEHDAPLESWEIIESRLEKKEKRRIIPLWWMFSGVAAVFIIGFFIVTKGGFLQQNNHQDVPVVNIENNSSSNQKKDGEKDKINNDQIINKSTSINDVATNDVDADEINTNDIDANNIGTNNSEKTKVNDIKKVTFRKTRKQHNTLTSGVNNNSIASNSEEKSYNKETYDKNNTKQVALENNTINNTNSSLPSITLEKNLVEPKKQLNSENSVAVQENNLKDNDSIQPNNLKKNTLGELLNEKESKTNKEPVNNRWQIASNIAPVFMGSFSSGSPIDGTLSKNSKQYNTGLSLGVGVAYRASDKITLRTGVNKFVVDYNTNDIAFSAGLFSKGMTNIDMVPDASNIIVQDFASSQFVAPEETNIVQNNKGVINQKIGYFEIPLEMSYALIDKKFGLNVIAGMSTLLLNENEVSLTSNSMNMVLGEANNLNSIHFSTNFGIGMKYKILKALEYNLEPTFKYQLNTFSSGSGNFKPYLFGVYTGLSYKF
ncbi:hypothetical protein GCM10011508_06630 [Flavobacterium lutivivi]|nr:hypothetical protein GCM10011508_06630 [Flavobacterium lutivivi]